MPLLGYSNLNKLKSVCSFKWLQEEFSAVTSIFSILRATPALARTSLLCAHIVSNDQLNNISFQVPLTARVPMVRQHQHQRLCQHLKTSRSTVVAASHHS